MVGDVGDELGHFLLPESLRGLQPMRREELGGAQPSQGAPLVARRQAEHGVVAVAAGAHGVADGPRRDVGVVRPQDLARHVRGRGDDGEDSAEAERHERAVPRGEARQGVVRHVVQLLVEVADQRERPWAWWETETAARVTEELEDV